MFGGGTEITFTLSLPFCRNCVKTASRRPPTLLKAILLAALASLGVLAVLLPTGMALVRPPP